MNAEPLYPAELIAEANSNVNADFSVNKQLPWMVMLGILSGFAVALSLFAWYEAQQAQRESRLVEYYLMDPHSRTPEELAAWSKFQLEHEKR